MTGKKNSMRTFRLALNLAAVALVASIGFATIAPAQELNPTRATVTITNITRDQVFSPPLVVTHDKRVSLFSLGDPASEELAALAEDGMTGPLHDLLDGATGVLDMAMFDGMILPGDSASVEIDISHRQSLVSLAGMLVSTNDAFFSLNSTSVQVWGFRPFRKIAAARAYDAGSEANTESCEHIPGPPCGNPGVRVTDGAEGFITVHSGIHGIGDLEASMKDWNNPVALITIERAD